MHCSYLAVVPCSRNEERTIMNFEFPPRRPETNFVERQLRRTAATETRNTSSPSHASQLRYSVGFFGLLVSTQGYLSFRKSLMLKVYAFRSTCATNRYVSHPIHSNTDPSAKPRNVAVGVIVHAFLNRSHTKRLLQMLIAEVAEDRIPHIHTTKRARLKNGETRR